MIVYLKNQGGYKMKDFKGMSYDDIRLIFEKVWDQIHSFVPMDSEEEVRRLKRAGQDVEAKPAKRQRTKEVSETDEEPKTDELSQEHLNQMSMQSHKDISVHHVSTEKGQDIFMLVEKDYPLTKGLATLMLSNKLRVDQQSEMEDELLTKIYNIANKPRKYNGDFRWVPSLTRGDGWPMPACHMAVLTCQVSGVQVQGTNPDAMIGYVYEEAVNSLESRKFTETYFSSEEDNSCCYMIEHEEKSCSESATSRFVGVGFKFESLFVCEVCSVELKAIKMKQAGECHILQERGVPRWVLMRCFIRSGYMALFYGRGDSDDDDQQSDDERTEFNNDDKVVEVKDSEHESEWKDDEEMTDAGQVDAENEEASQEVAVFEAGDTQVPQDLREYMGNTVEPPVAKADPKDWFKKPERPPTPDPKWNEGKTVDNKPTHKWLSDLAKAEISSKAFNDLMSTPIDFRAFIMNRLQISDLTQDILIGPAYKILKGTYRSYVEIEYNMEECYKALTDQLDWNNPEGDRYPFDLSNPLLLVKSGNRQIILVDYFFNNDLAYLQGGSTDRTYMTSLIKTKAAKYDLPGIEDMVTNLWSSIKVAYDKHALLEGDFLRIHLHDIEDMLPLIVQNRLFNLKGKEIVHLAAALRMFTRRIVIQKRVEDLQLGVES
ncbi:hypothetical protein Tco_1069647 [Tanacetum coccineum]|uniref:Uncharacterized protein n=1 Tax=Tanacetum coccineum TaxID=301880 RepID=A0ABQ5HL21_9ASTR